MSNRKMAKTRKVGGGPKPMKLNVEMKNMITYDPKQIAMFRQKVARGEYIPSSSKISLVLYKISRGEPVDPSEFLKSYWNYEGSWADITYAYDLIPRQKAEQKERYNSVIAELKGKISAKQLEEEQRKLKIRQSEDDLMIEYLKNAGVDESDYSYFISKLHDYKRASERAARLKGKIQSIDEIIALAFEHVVKERGIKTRKEIETKPVNEIKPKVKLSKRERNALKGNTTKKNNTKTTKTTKK